MTRASDHGDLAGGPGRLEPEDFRAEIAAHGAEADNRFFDQPHRTADAARHAEVTGERPDIGAPGVVGLTRRRPFVSSKTNAVPQPRCSPSIRSFSDTSATDETPSKRTKPRLPGVVAGNVATYHPGARR